MDIIYIISGVYDQKDEIRKSRILISIKNMIYLGIHNSYQAGAALIKNGKIIGAVSEERFNRIKDYHGMPNSSIDYLLNISNTKLNNVDKIVYGMVTSNAPDEKVLIKLINRIVNGITDNPEIKDKYIDRIYSEIKWNKRHLEELNSWAKKNSVIDKLEFIDHHHSHAAAAFYTSPFENSMIFTCDGKGNFKSSCVGKGEGEKLHMLDFQTTFDSVGYFYGNITKALGFQAERHEGKVTGLAAFGNPEKFTHITDKILSFKDGSIELSLGKYYLPWFVEENDLPEFYSEVKKYKREDVAAATQQTVEKVLTKWVEKSIQKYNGDLSSNVCLSGGVFANVKLNQRIRELDIVNNVFVQPAMGDMGIPLGSCIAQMEKDGNPFKKFVESMDLGPSFSDRDVKSVLTKKQYEYKKIKFIEDELAQYIDLGKVVGFFQGGMEYGPRALCNRSILYHCRDNSANDWLNKRLNRTEFMPFAPVTTEELAEKCFIGWSKDDKSADFMTMTYNVTNEFKKCCPAAVHIDDTARPQIIRKNINPKMHSIITHYYNTRGDLALINTSFNNHEEPIVWNIDNALDSLSRNNIDVLFIENFIVYPKK